MRIDDHGVVLLCDHAVDVLRSDSRQFARAVLLDILLRLRPGEPWSARVHQGADAERGDANEHDGDVAVDLLFGVYFSTRDNAVGLLRNQHDPTADLFYRVDARHRLAWHHALGIMEEHRDTRPNGSSIVFSMRAMEWT